MFKYKSSSSSPSTSSSSSGFPAVDSGKRLRGDYSPDVVEHHQQQLHRSSPLAALNSIYVIDPSRHYHLTGSSSPHRHVTGTSSPGRAWCSGGDGVVNCGFVGDGILTDSWRRVSWRARLRAGIARSTTLDQSRAGIVRSTTPHRPTTDQSSASSSGSDVITSGPNGSYLTDVIDSVTFFSEAGATGNRSARTCRTHARTEFPQIAVTRCQSDGGEWTLGKRCGGRFNNRPASLINRK